MFLNQSVSEIVRQAEEAYGFRVTAAEQAGYGSGNRNFILTTDQDSFVLCLIEEQSADEVYAMARTLKWLADHDYPSTPLRETADRKLTTIIDKKPALLRGFLRGDVCWKPNESQLRQVGASLAKLHQIPCPQFLPTDIYYTQERFVKALTSGHDPVYESWVRRSLARLNVWALVDLPRGLIHADAFADNVLFDGENLVAIIDFELACNYFFAFDLAMAIIGLCLDDQQPCPSRINSLIVGYEEIRRLDAREVAAIAPLTEYAAIMTSLWRYWRYRCYEKDHPKRNAYREMVSVVQHTMVYDFSTIWSK